MTARMLYWLQDDEEASRIFAGDDAEMLHNKKWQDIEKISNVNYYLCE